MRNLQLQLIRIQKSIQKSTSPDLDNSENQGLKKSANPDLENSEK